MNSNYDSTSFSILRWSLIRHFFDSNKIIVCPEFDISNKCRCSMVSHNRNGTLPLDSVEFSTRHEHCADMAMGANNLPSPNRSRFGEDEKKSELFHWNGVLAVILRFSYRSHIERIVCIEFKHPLGRVLEPQSIRGCVCFVSLTLTVSRLSQLSHSKAQPIMAW